VRLYHTRMILQQLSGAEAPRFAQAWTAESLPGAQSNGRLSPQWFSLLTIHRKSEAIFFS